MCKGHTIIQPANSVAAVQCIKSYRCRSRDAPTDNLRHQNGQKTFISVTCLYVEHWHDHELVGAGRARFGNSEMACLLEFSYTIVFIQNGVKNKKYPAIGWFLGGNDLLMRHKIVSQTA